MAELADAQDSGSCVRKDVGVQVPPRPPCDVDLERRTLRHHVAFGRGIHHCVGAPLARLEAKIVLDALLDRTSSFSLDPDNAPVWADSLQIRRYERLPLKLEER